MTNHSSSYVSPISRAKGLGSAKSGTHHWLMERMTSIAAVPLSLWLVWSVAALAGADYETFTAWLATPWNAVLMILSILTLFYHAVLGSQVIIEDYIHTKWFRLTKLIGMKLFFTALAVTCIFSVLKIAL